MTFSILAFLVTCTEGPQHVDDLNAGVGAIAS